MPRHFRHIAKLARGALSLGTHPGPKPRLFACHSISLCPCLPVICSRRPCAPYVLLTRCRHGVGSRSSCSVSPTPSSSSSTSPAKRSSTAASCKNSFYGFSTLSTESFLTALPACNSWWVMSYFGVRGKIHAAAPLDISAAYIWALMTSPTRLLSQSTEESTKRTQHPILTTTVSTEGHQKQASTTTW
eukprot:scaffold22929_cov32-Tisochrysis_lutea.AAC.4